MSSQRSNATSQTCLPRTNGVEQRDIVDVAGDDDAAVEVVRRAIIENLRCEKYVEWLRPADHGDALRSHLLGEAVGLRFGQYVRSEAQRVQVALVLFYVRARGASVVVRFVDGNVGPLAVLAVDKARNEGDIQSHRIPVHLVTRVEDASSRGHASNHRSVRLGNPSRCVEHLDREGRDVPMLVVQGPAKLCTKLGTLLELELELARADREVLPVDVEVGPNVPHGGHAGGHGPVGGASTNPGRSPVSVEKPS